MKAGEEPVGGEEPSEPLLVVLDFQLAGLMEPARDVGKSFLFGCPQLSALNYPQLSALN